MASKAVRVMKARKSSRVSCGCYVLRGQQIVRRGGQWTCLRCDRIPPSTEIPGEQKAATGSLSYSPVAAFYGGMIATR